ncbi:MAG: DegT/DnrJ/EryC1/StrS family aminotransferase [Candidatus Omnitrophica bacterium]|nr:DegT/DnrJ/EryC1/StrS family aminotransferase [Candidatus Omnitrophota bacterium]
MKSISETIDLLLNCAGKSHLSWMSRGATAIYVVLKALSATGVQVIIPSNICLSVVAAILFSGNSLHLIDIELGSQSISPEGLTSVDRSKKSVVIYPHMYGICHQNILKIKDICRERGWFLIEDCAQSPGASVAGERAGSFGDAAVFSFGAGKIVDCGYGGAIATDDKQLVDELNKIYSKIGSGGVSPRVKERTYTKAFKALYAIGESRRNIDLSKPFLALLNVFKGAFIYRADELPFDRIRSGLSGITENLKERMENAILFRQEFDNSGIDYIRHPEGSAYWRFNILYAAKTRNALLRSLHSKGLYASSWFPSVDRFFKKRAPGEEALFETSDYIGDRILNLWVNHEVDKDYVYNATSIITAFNN